MNADVSKITARLNPDDAKIFKTMEWGGKKYFKIEIGLSNSCRDCCFHSPQTNEAGTIAKRCGAFKALPYFLCGVDTWTDSLDKAITARLKS